MQISACYVVDSKAGPVERVLVSNWDLYQERESSSPVLDLVPQEIELIDKAKLDTLTIQNHPKKTIGQPFILFADRSTLRLHDHLVSHSIHAQDPALREQHSAFTTHVVL